MLRLRLTRLFEHHGGTFGLLEDLGGALRLYTVERPWLGNRPSVSCVPTGDYTLEEHSSRRFPKTWALVGRTVSHFPAGKARSAVLFHAGNRPADLRGCIAPGLVLGTLHGRAAVTSSRRAMTKLRKVAADDTPRGMLLADKHRLTITNLGGPQGRAS